MQLQVKSITIVLETVHEQRIECNRKSPVYRIGAFPTPVAMMKVVLRVVERWLMLGFMIGVRSSDFISLS